jgi:hypothetical protein
MTLFSGGAVTIETGTDGKTELTGTVAAFKDAQGWWAALTAPAASVTSKSAVVGRRAQITAPGVSAWANVSDCVQLVAPMPTVQLLLRGEGDAPF